ncbi:hypothetical protein V5O48_001687 [Marasmius crinis-equi]|uniref:Tyrosine specific protein phosphatases domain-containing protein n=1 Tax=Marasmius crinis-equi TaxID=585013 RepID=A0ABR3FXT5_9AGAR
MSTVVAIPSQCPLESEVVADVFAAPHQPITGLMPQYREEMFQDLRSRQVQSSTTQLWWHHALRSSASPLLLGPSGATTDPGTQSTELTRELYAAMDEELTSPPPQIMSTPAPHPVKTSSSHPIKVSYVIPAELLALVSSHLLLTPSVPSNVYQPTIFELPAPFTLDRLTNAHHPMFRLDPRTAFPCPFPPPAYSETTFACHLQTRSHVSEALQAAINSGLQNESSTLPHPPPKLFDAIPPYEDCTVKTFHTTKDSVSLALSVTKVKSPIETYEVFDATSPPPPESRLYAPPTPFLDPSFDPPSPLLPPSSPSPALGNLLLSSCPGKKVRLDGPVRGRSAVCRDLESDLRRMKETGVGCIVCCLDDGELEFLGAPWPEYERVTKMIGLDVLRLPTPEGLPPTLSPMALDTEITTLIDRYTVRGIPVLVHCRGGVGRAGVVACCWTIKLGLCGWLDEVADPSTSSLALVEKVISVIRRRRGAKAVETYEQAKFLVDYVNYLKIQNQI